jgi:hypothetical protein
VGRQLGGGGDGPGRAGARLQHGELVGTVAAGPDARQPEEPGGGRLGFGRIVAVHDRSSTLDQIHEENTAVWFF